MRLARLCPSDKRAGESGAGTRFPPPETYPFRLRLTSQQPIWGSHLLIFPLTSHIIDIIPPLTEQDNPRQLHTQQGEVETIIQPIFIVPGGHVLLCHAPAPAAMLIHFFGGGLLGAIVAFLAASPASPRRYVPNE
jgi:hypothetical protein